MPKNRFRLSGLLRSEQGGVAMFMAITLVAGLVIFGLPIDMGRAQMVRNKMQNAMDAAALAAATMPYGTETGIREKTARRYYTANYPENYMGGNITADSIGVAIADGKVTVTGGTEVATTYMPVGGGPQSVGVNTQSVTLFEKTVPAAIDIVIGLDGGCGNEDNRKYGPMEDGMFGLLNAIAQQDDPNLPSNTLPGADANSLKYASGSWDGKSAAGQNGSHDHFNTTGDLRTMFSRVGSRDRVHGDNGTSIPSVIREMLQRHFVQNEARPAELVAKKLRIAVIFQGASHRNEGSGGNVFVRNPESIMPQWCNNLKNSFDGVYTVAVGGPTNSSNNCGGMGSWSGAASLQNCAKPINGITFPAYSQIDRFALPTRMRELGAELGRIKVSLPTNARIEQ